MKHIKIIAFVFVALVFARVGYAQFNAALNEPFTPASISGLTAAWRADQGVSTTANSTFIAGAWQTTNTLSSSRVPGAAEIFPRISTSVGPVNQNILRFYRPQNQVMTISNSLNSTSWTAFIALAPVTITNGQTFGIFGQARSNNNYIGFSGKGSSPTTTEAAVKLSVRPASGAETQCDLPILLNKNMNLLTVTYDGVSGILIPSVNGVQGKGCNVGTSGFSFNRVGATGNAAGSTNYFDGYLPLILYYNRVLITPERAAIENYQDVLNFRGRDVYINNATGLDGTKNQTFWSSNTPLQSITGARRISDNAGMNFTLMRGTTFRNQYIVPQVSSAIITMPIAWRSQPGGGNPPRVWGGQDVYDGWTFASPYSSRVYAINPAKVWYFTSGGQIIGLEYAGATATPPSGFFGYTGGTLYLNLDGSTSANGLRVVIASDATNITDAFDTGQANTQAIGLDMRFWSRSGGSLAANDVKMISNYIGFNAGDGIDFNGNNLRMVAEANEVANNGTNTATPGSNGDGVSAHGNSTSSVINNYIHDNLRSGIGNERGAQMYADRNFITKNHRDVVIFDQSSSGSFVGGITLTNNVIAHRGTDRVGYAVLFCHTSTETPQGCTGSTGGNFYNWYVAGNTIVSLNAGQGIGIGVLTPSAIITGNIIRGLSAGIVFSGAGRSLKTGYNYNDYFGNTTDVSGGGGPNDANSITSNPDMVDFSGGDYRLNSGSPAINTSDPNLLTAPGLFFNHDYLGVPRPQPLTSTTPDMGAYERPDY